MMVPSTHASLLLAMQNNDHQDEAWEAFHALYRDVILVWCRRRSLPQDGAEDLAQEALLKLFQQLPSYDSAKGRFRSWLKAVVNNALTDYWRRQRQRPEQGGAGGSDFLDRLAQLQTPETADELSGVIEDRAKAILNEASARVQARVEANTWEAFYQTFEEKRPAADVAKALALSVGTVYTYAKRVKKLLQEEIRNVRPSR